MLTIRLKTDDQGEQNIYLAPEWYLEEAGLTVKPGDKIKVVVREGYMPWDGKSLVGGKPPKGGKTIDMLDESGCHVWWGNGYHYGDRSDPCDP